MFVQNGTMGKSIIVLLFFESMIMDIALLIIDDFDLF